MYLQSSPRTDQSAENSLHLSGGAGEYFMSAVFHCALRL
jgi:hypothetical protein